MDRIGFASRLIADLPAVESLLDVGCRSCELAKHLPPAIVYSGADLYQNAAGSVSFVGDIDTIDIGATFDCVVALDLLEHIDDPSEVFDKLISLATKTLIVSLPNCYDLKGRMKFLFGGSLGGKYHFANFREQDRHRWVIGRRELHEFYAAKAAQHGARNHFVIDMLYGDPSSSSFISRVRSIARILPRSLCTETVFGVFTK